MSCVFCSIVNHVSPAYVVHEDEHTVSFLDIHPATEGHTVVVPRRHADDIWNIDAAGAAALFRAAHAVAGLVRERLEPDGLTLFQANGRAGWQDVFHLHLHVVPRYAGDRLVRPWALSPERTGDLGAVADRLGARVTGAL